jgi:hypothetical protein
VRNKTCAECGKSQDDSTELHEIIMPPELPSKTVVCSTCFEMILDNERNKKVDIK